MLRIITASLLLAASVAVAGESDHTEPTGVLTLRQALALVLSRSPELAAFDYDIRIAEARILQAKSIPNPEADFTGESVAGTDAYSNADQSENTLLLSQLIELGGKRRARVREAGFGRELAGLDYEIRKREVFRKTAEHFVDLLAGQRRVALSEELVRLANEFAPAVEKRVEAGRTSSLEKMRFDMALGSARIDLEEARRNVLAGRQRLAAQWGSSRPRFASVAGDLDATPATASLDILARRLPANPRLARFGVEVAQREAALAREKAAVVPDLTLRAGVRQIEETEDVTAVVGFSLPLPLWNRNEGNIRATRAQISRTGAEQATVSAALMTELTDAYQTLSRARATIQILREEVLPGGESALTATTEGYEAGRFSYIDVLDARRTISTARLQYLQAIIDYHKALHAVEALTADPRPHNLP